MLGKVGFDLGGAFFAAFAAASPSNTSFAGFNSGRILGGGSKMRCWPLIAALGCQVLIGVSAASCVDHRYLRSN